MAKAKSQKDNKGNGNRWFYTFVSAGVILSVCLVMDALTPLVISDDVNGFAKADKPMSSEISVVEDASNPVVNTPDTETDELDRVNNDIKSIPTAAILAEYRGLEYASQITENQLEQENASENVIYSIAVDDTQEDIQDDTAEISEPEDEVQVCYFEEDTETDSEMECVEQIKTVIPEPLNSDNGEDVTDNVQEEEASLEEENTAEEFNPDDYTDWFTVILNKDVYINQEINRAGQEVIVRNYNEELYQVQSDGSLFLKDWADYPNPPVSYQAGGESIEG